MYMKLPWEGTVIHNCVCMHDVERRAMLQVGYIESSSSSPVCGRVRYASGVGRGGAAPMLLCRSMSIGGRAGWSYMCLEVSYKYNYIHSLYLYCWSAVLLLVQNFESMGVFSLHMGLPEASIIPNVRAQYGQQEGC